VARVHGATIRQAHAQRDSIERVTGMDVEPLLVYSRAWVDRPLARRKGVRVLPARMLVGHVEQARNDAFAQRRRDRARAPRAGAARARARRASRAGAADPPAVADGARANPAVPGLRARRIVPR